MITVVNNHIYRSMDDKLLHFFQQNIGKPVTYQQIHEAIPDFITNGYVSVAVSRLRKKHNIDTIHRRGYIYRGRK